MFASQLSAASARRIRLWLVVIALMIAGLVLLGGATRLTDSGLSITEWRPVTGILPPLFEDGWLDEFVKYQGIPEYQIVNRGMTIDEFKTIYWWEWSHRFAGRLIGLAFFAPLLWFLFTRQLTAGLAGRLLAILLLGGFQGALGWYMVSSGVAPGAETRVDVSQYRLAAHLATAVLIFGAVLWTAFGLKREAAWQGGVPFRWELRAGVLVVLIFLQIILGALVAGLDAGLTFNTWPLMDGRLVPGGLDAMSPWYLNLFENVATVQFNHRMLAYVIFVLALLHVARVMGRRLEDERMMHGRGSALVLLLAIFAQGALGVFTLLTGVPILLGLLHQAGALAVFAAALQHFYIVTREIRPE